MENGSFAVKARVPGGPHRTAENGRIGVKVRIETWQEADGVELWLADESEETREFASDFAHLLGYEGLPHVMQELSLSKEEALTQAMRDAAGIAWDGYPEWIGESLDHDRFELTLMDDEGGQVIGLVNGRVAWTLSTDPEVPSGPPILRERYSEIPPSPPPHHRGKADLAQPTKNAATLRDRGVFIGSGGRIRTYDLRVMSPTSYRTAPPRSKATGESIWAGGSVNSAQRIESPL